MNSKLENILLQFPHDVRHKITVTTLDGGMTNQTYRLDLNDEAFVLRLFGENTHLLGIDRQREKTCTAIVAQSGIGATMESWISGKDFMMTRFIEGKHLTVDSAKHPETIQRIITSLLNCHNGQAFPGYYSPFESIRTYYHLACKRGVLFPESLSQVFALMSKIEAIIGYCDDPKSCHNDLLLGNFIDDGETIRIIDWEYAAMGDPFFDLGFLAVDLGLNENQCKSLLYEYFGKVTPEDLAHLYLMRLISDLREAFCSWLLSATSQLNVDYTTYSLKRYERFLSHAKTPQFYQWLEQLS